MADLVASYGLKVEAAFGAAPLSDLTGAWFDVTTDVHSFSTNRGRSGGLDTFDAGQAHVDLNNNAAKYDPTNSASVWWRTRLNLPGASGDYAYTTDSMSWTDLDLRVKVAATDWTPSGAQTLLAQWNGATSQQAFWFRLETTGKLRLDTSSDGSSTSTSTTSSVAPSFTDGDTYWVRVTHDVDNGSSQNVVKFFTSDDDGETWTQLGTTVTNTGTTSIYAATSRVTVGAQNNSGANNRLVGKVHRAVGFKTINGADSSVQFAACFDAGVGTGNTTFTDNAGKAWTVAGAASIESVGKTTIVPFVPVRISMTTSSGGRARLFTGFIQSQGISLEYAPPNRSVVKFDCVDFFAFLGRYEIPKRERPLNVGKTVTALISAQLVAGRLPRPYDGWTIYDSKVPTQGDVGGKSALQWLEQMVQTEGSPGFYIDRDGSPTFLNRNAPKQLTRMSTSQETFGPSDTPHGADGFEMEYASEIWNAASVSVVENTTENNPDSTYSDTTSIRAYGRSEFTASDLLCDPGPDADALAEWVVKAFKEPAASPKKMRLYPLTSSTVRNAALNRQLLDRVTVSFTAPGRNAAKTYDCFVERIEHEASAADGSWTTTFELSSADRYDFADASAWLVLGTGTLNSSTNGKLGL